MLSLPVKNFVPVIRFGFNDSNKPQHQLRIVDSFGQNILQELIPARRAELVWALRHAADEIESGWLSAPARNYGKSGNVAQQPQERHCKCDNLSTREDNVRVCVDCGDEV